MVSIIGAGIRVSQAKKERPRSRARGRYLDRNKALPYLGYANYQEYLKSDDWKALRQIKLAESSVCQCCGSNKKISIHHYCYNDSVMLGLFPGLLIVVCDQCHELIEFIPGERRKKNSLRHAQKRLHTILLLHGKKQLSKQIIVTHNEMWASERAAKKRREEAAKQHRLELAKWESDRKARLSATTQHPNSV